MPKTIERLSALKVARLKTPGLHPDGNGLYLQITTGQGKSWVFRYSVRVHMISLHDITQYVVIFMQDPHFGGNVSAMTIAASHLSPGWLAGSGRGPPEPSGAEKVTISPSGKRTATAALWEMPLSHVACAIFLFGECERSTEEILETPIGADLRI